MKVYQSIAVDYNYMYVICPNKFCKDHIHHYPSCSDIKNRREITKSICKVDQENDVCIRVDDTTSRTTLTYYPNKSITISKRKYMQQQKIYDPKFVEKNKIKVRHGKFILKFE